MAGPKRVRKGEFRNEILKEGDKSISGFSVGLNKLAGCFDKSITIWDVENKNKKLENISITTSDDLDDDDILMDGKILFYRNAGVVNVVDVDTGKQIYTINQNLRPRFACNGFLFCATDLPHVYRGNTSYIKIFEIKDGKEIISIPFQESEITDINVSGKNLFVALDTFGTNGVISQFDIPNAVEINTFQIDGFFPSKIALAGNTLFCSGYNFVNYEKFNYIMLWDRESGELLKEIKMTGPMRLCNIFPIEEMLIVCTNNGTIEVVEYETGKIIHTICKSRFIGTSMAMSNFKLFMKGGDIEVFDFGLPEPSN